MPRKPPAQTKQRVVKKTAKKAAPKAIAAQRQAPKRSAPSKEILTPVVGIGASAGGLEAFTQLLGALPVDTGLAFVLIQHLEPTHKSVLSPLLARATKMPVSEVRERMSIEPNHVYVIPANADLSLLDGLLHLEGRKAPPGRHLPIDYFFSSLAESRGARAIGIVLSGTASDGTVGIKAIKEAGGITFAQSPESAKFDGMPRNAIASGCVDLVLPPERIAKELARLAHVPFASLPAPDSVPSVPADEEDWVRLFRILNSGTGIDFSLYKKSTVKRRLARRMAVCKADKLRAYLRILETNRSELDALFEELLILVTEFFRDPDVFAALEQRVFPKILAEKRAGEPIRIWIAGCSTGQELYSIAISLLHCLGDKASGTQIQMFGTDISEKAIEKARIGIYPAAELKPIPQERLRRYFTKVNGSFQINEAIRDLCIFAGHDLTRDPPFSRLDLISCRNVLIYMEPALQKRILASFHYGLQAHGTLLLGKSESLGSYSDLFIAKDRKNKFFRKGEGAHAPKAFIQPSYGQTTQPRPARETPASLDLEKEATQLVWERYAHAGLVVNADLQILHFLGDTSPYIRHTPGKASLQLIRTLREEFVLEVRSAIQKARRGETAVRREGIEFDRNEHTETVNLEIRPLVRSGPDRSFLILFERAGPVNDVIAARGTGKGAKPKAGDRSTASRDREVARLRTELVRTRDYVRAIIRDQEATNEELKTANEEALSSMEELQSTNEELETAKEELQSSNEELVTLNEQLQNRNAELGLLSTDLGNVLTGVDIPVVILGADRRIRRFTPPAEKLLGLIPGDIGRPIGKIRLGLNIPDVDGLISRAIATGEEETHEVQSENGRWYSVRLRPFLAGEDKVKGVLMAFVDIHELKQLQHRTTERAEQSESTARALLESAAYAILACDEQGRIRLANATAEKMFVYSRDMLLGRSLESLMPERFRTPHAQFRGGWFAAPSNRPMGAALALAGIRSDGTEFPIEVTISILQAEGTALGVAFVSDVTDRRKIEAQVLSQVSALELLLRTNNELWRSHDLHVGLMHMVDAGIALLGAQMGNIQLLDPRTRTLHIVAQRGFSPEFLEHFREVSVADGAASGRSLRNRARTVIGDVNEDPTYAKDRPAAAAAGYRAVQSTPLFGSDGEPIGMFNTHFSSPHRPDELDLIRFDLYASQAAQFIERVGGEAQMQRLTRALLLTQEEGNRTIARELHDVFSQELIGIGMELASLKKIGNPEAVQTLSRKITDLANRLHQVSRNMHPAVLEDLGLEPALRQQVESFQKATGIPTDFTSNSVPKNIPLDLSLCLFRVAQEALRNIQKHATKSERVWVSLDGHPNGITLAVRNPGDGFDFDEALRKGGLGLISMEERVRAEDGKLSIQSAPGQGTTVQAFLPLPGASEAAGGA